MLSSVLLTQGELENSVQAPAGAKKLRNLV